MASSVRSVLQPVFAHAHNCCVQVHNGDEVVRERAIRLIHTKMKTSATEFANKETQAELIAQIKKVFASGNVTAEEFPR